MQNTHISKVALFVSTAVWQSGGDAAYCKTAITACWVLPKLPSGRWAACLPLLHRLLPPHSRCLFLSLLVFLTPAAFQFPPLTFLSSSGLLYSPSLYTCASTALQAWITHRNRHKREDWKGDEGEKRTEVYFFLSSISFSLISLFCCCSVMHTLISNNIHILTCTKMQTLSQTHIGSASSSSGCSIWTVVCNQCLRGQPRLQWGEVCELKVGGLQLWVVAVHCCALTHRVIVLHTPIRLMYYRRECVSPLPLTHIIQTTPKSMSQIELVVI